MSTLFSLQGSAIFLKRKENLNLSDNIPAGTYSIKITPTEELFLETVDNFSLPKKVYGSTEALARRMLHTFAARAKATGVLLCGEKGSGKSLLAKLLAVRALEQGMPTILINAPWTGDKFFQLIQSIHQPAIVLFDEFEKIYDSDKQKEVLTLLDGIYPSNKLYIFTVNDKWKLDTNMRNRPGRIFYSLDYKGLEESFIREYCEDNLNNKAHIDQVVRVSCLFENFNFDMLQALIEEMNRYDETPVDALKMLNIKTEYEDASQFKINFRSASVPESHVEMETNDIIRVKPLSGEIRIAFYAYKNLMIPKDDDANEQEYRMARFFPGNVQKISPDGGTFEFVNAEGDYLKLTRHKEPGYDYSKAFGYAAES